MRANRRLERTLGYCALGLALVGLIVLLAQGGVRAEVARVAQALTGGGSAGDRTLPVPSLVGIQPGLPLYRVTAAGDARPVGHVAETLADPPRVRLRPAPGESLAALTHVQVFAPSRKLSAALGLAFPDAEAKAFGRDVATRLEQLWRRYLLPDLQKRLPAFLERIDPTKETQARKLFEEVGGALMTRTRPMLDELLEHVMSAVKDKLGVLDRLGLLWDLVRGDEAGIRDALAPTAKKAGTAWWTKNQSRVLSGIGEGLAEKWPQIQAWATGELLDAALGELLQPVFDANRATLEAEGERLMRDAVARFVEAPGGGFRIRFAALLRQNLLDKETALLLWLPEDAPGDD